MQRRLVVGGAVALLVVLAGLIVAGCGGKKADDAVVARVNGDAITRAEVVKVLEQQDSGAALEGLIARQLVRQKAKERGITASKEEIERRLGAMSDYVLAESGQNLDQWLVEHGQTLDDLQQAVSLQVLTSKLIIPESEKKKFFEANKARLQDLPHNNESVIYRRIVLGTKAEAEAVKKMLDGKADPDIAKVAADKSLDPMTRPRGGMAGWMVKGRSVAEDKDLEKVLFSLKPGTISDPLPFQPMAMTQSGAPDQWQVVSVVKHIPAHPLRLEDNEDQIESALLSPPQGEAQPANMQLYAEAQQFFQDMQTKARIEILSPRYKALDERYKQQREAAEKMKTMGGPEMPGGVPGGAAPAPAGK